MAINTIRVVLIACLHFTDYCFTPYFLAMLLLCNCARSWVPVYSDPSQKLAVMSIGFLLGNRDDAVVWRGPKKNGTVYVVVANNFVYYSL